MSRDRYDVDRDFLPPRRSSNAALHLALAVIGGLVLVGCLAVGGAMFMWTRVESDKSRPGKSGQVYVAVTVAQLVDEWKQNPAAAADKYKRTGVVLTGVLNGIDSHLGGQVCMEIGSTREKGTEVRVFCLSPAALDQLKRVKVGDQVTVTARAEGTVNPIPWLVAEDIRPAN
jgi:hypothetical protein